MSDGKRSQWPTDPPWNAPMPRLDHDGPEVVIPSAAVRAELNRVGHKLTDLEKAVLLDRSHMVWQEKLARLAALRDHTADEQLKHQLDGLIEQREQALNVFLDNADGSALYRSVCTWNDESGESAGELVPTAEEAWFELMGDADSPISEFRVDRLPILQTADEAPRVASAFIGDDGSLLSLRGMPDREWESYLSGHFGELPHPFHRGDIVCTTDGKVHGVVEAGSAYQAGAGIRQSPGPWNEAEEPFRVAVFNEKTGLFGSTAAIPPEHLEYYQAQDGIGIGSMNELLRMMSDIYKGRGWMPEFTGYTYWYREGHGYRD